MSEHDDLLQQFLPRLRYDSNEQYFADSAGEWTDNPGHELRRADGTLLARAPTSRSACSGAATYSDGREAKASDFISDPQARLPRPVREAAGRAPRPRNRVYGHAVEDNGRLWLQYYLWYFYNDYSLALGAGLHEGDWEMVQFRMHDAQPDVAVYAQHTYGEQRPWSDVEKRGRPARRLRRPRLARLLLRGRLPHHRGLVRPRRRQAPRRRSRRSRSSRTTPRRGRAGPAAGATPSRGSRAASSSRARPARAPRSSGATPTRCSTRRARRCASRPPRRPRSRSPAPATGCASTFDFERRDPAPRSLVVTVNSRDEAGVPPRTLHVHARGHAAAARSTRASRPTRRSTTTSTRAPRRATRRCRRSRR